MCQTGHQFPSERSLPLRGRSQLHQFLSCEEEKENIYSYKCIPFIEPEVIGRTSWAIEDLLFISFRHFDLIESITHESESWIHKSCSTWIHLRGLVVMTRCALVKGTRGPLLSCTIIQAPHIPHWPPKESDRHGRVVYETPDFQMLASWLSCDHPEILFKACFWCWT